MKFMLFPPPIFKYDDTKKIVSAAQNNLFFIVKWFKKEINTEFCT